jgi:multisubunit Na+/H+ antiporter MnhB subunit
MRTVVTVMTVRILTPMVVLVAAYVLLRGHASPGGGFAAGLLVGVWLTLCDFVLGREVTDRLVSVGTPRLVGAGLLLALGTAVLPLLLGDPVLAIQHWTLEMPWGPLELTTALVFETGIALIVVGLVVAVVEDMELSA